MPIYEFYCADCHRVFSFLSRAVNTAKQPSCPRCGKAELPRKPSVFAVSRGRAKPAESPAAEGPDDPRLEQAMASLAGEMEGMNDDDPRQAARLMRKVYDAAGMPIGSGMEEALRRMELGEDPDKVEEEMGDVLGEDPFAAAGEGAAKEGEGGLRGLRRRALPPSVDTTLYEM
jgi:putative FmdB family regulatory protein